MTRDLVDRIADAVLYEGYVLYPYRPSVKNRQRWTFGGLYPEAYCRGQGGADASGNRTECLVRGRPETVVAVAVRFLHLTARQVGEIVPGGRETWRPVELLRVGERVYHTWQEAEEREVMAGEIKLGGPPAELTFSFPGRQWREPITAAAGTAVGELVRRQEVIDGMIRVSAVPVADGLFRLAVTVDNRTPFDGGGPADRDAALMRSLVSTHVRLGVRGGEFVSLLDPPDDCRDHAAACRNVGVWPVLVGEAGQTDTMLSSPIILYDYPQVAPESPGDLFDGTEIDEILSLRVLTLTDEEKALAAGLDERVRALLTRTESLGPRQMLDLHGTVRGVRPVPGEVRGG